jgi:deoxyribodipyrimidine photo-lyase
VADRPVIVWFRQDLRLSDNPALAAAIATGRPVLPLFILDDDTPGRWAWGGASRWWLHHSLAALGADLAKRGAPLTLRRGVASDVLRDVIRESAAGAVFWNRCYEPFAVARDTALKADLGVDVQSFGTLLHEPARLATKAGTPFKVFTPFWTTLRNTAAPPPPLRAPSKIEGARLSGDALDDWALLPTKPDWAGGLCAAWTPGEAGAKARLRGFLGDDLGRYRQERDQPGKPSSSRLSPHLHWGEISARQVWHATLEQARQEGGGNLESDAWAFLRELGWREFCAHLLFHWPDLPEQPWRKNFEDFPWREGKAEFAAWSRGQTGYPIVDAGMRELWATGTMHNRVRMVVASFLVKHLLLPWQDGEAWFWDTLVDADLASNAGNWQWVAGTGADASPYFRIFNPVLQGEKFDAAGIYVRRWVPEIAGLPDKFLHHPWDAPDDVLAAAGVTLGGNYPAPMVDHAMARQRALAAYAVVKSASEEEG